MIVSYVERFLERLQGVQNVAPGEWTALSPLREEENPSLRISLTTDGRILLHDFGGDSTRTILRHLGIDFRSLYPPWNENPQGGSIAAVQEKREEEAPKWHDIYEYVVAGLTLDEPHISELWRRRICRQVAMEWGYRSVSWFSMKQVINNLLEEFGDARLLATPGFRRGRVGRVEPVIEDGLLIPVRNLEGKILALKVRTGGSPKYRWFSGGGSPSCGAPCHVHKGSEEDQNVVRIVEGPLKADVVGHLSGTTTIGIPGVSAWSKAIPLLEKLGTRNVLLAFDNDWRTNAGVAQCLLSLGNALQLDYKVLLEYWPLEWKGLDDALAHHYVAYENSCQWADGRPLIEKVVKEKRNTEHATVEWPEGVL